MVLPCKPSLPRTGATWRSWWARIRPPGLPNAHSLLEAQYGFGGELAHLRIVPLAIYAGDAPVGLAMYNTGPAFERFFIA